MIFENAVARLAKRLGQRGDLEDDIRFELQDAQTAILETNFYRFQFQLSEAQTVYSATGDDRLKLPDNFLAEFEGGALFIVTDAGAVIPLIKEDLDLLINKYGDTQAQPKFYARTGDYIRLYPIPDKAYQLRTVFYVKADTLTDGVENYWLEHASSYLIAETGALMALQYLHDTNLAKTFAAQSKAAFEALWRANEDSLQVNRDMIRGI